LRVAKPI
jgi:hypothetical protein